MNSIPRRALALVLAFWACGSMAAPESLGRYRILKEASHVNGRVIYAARNAIGQGQVFIKAAVEREMDKAAYTEAAAGFAHEARAAALLKSVPGVLQVYDTGTQDGMAYLVLESVSGQELGAQLTNGRHPDPRDAARIVAALLDVLDAVHKRGVVHRDLKPSNIVLTVDGRIKLADFGVARLPGKDPYAGAIVGTPAYMSPEQVRGEAVDGRSDLFAAGVVLYQLLTGRLPFADPNPQVTFNKVLGLDPPRPSSIDPRVGPLLDAIVAKALAKSPEARYANAREFAAALRQTTTALK